jgi:F-type H+-transporting ATPase subunit gamma
MASQRDVKDRIESVRNIAKITRAMEMVAAARLRRAEQRIATCVPYAGAIRRMTRQAAEAAGGEISHLPILQQHEAENRVGLLLVTGDRGLGRRVQLADPACRGCAPRRTTRTRAARSTSTPRVGAACRRWTFRGREPQGAYVGFTDRPPTPTRARSPPTSPAAYVDGKLDRVDIFYNGYVSPLVQEVRRETLLPLQEATILEAEEEDGDRARRARVSTKQALVEYEPEPEAILQRLVPQYVEISIYRALLESTASEHGARMTAMRNASENAGEVIEDLTLEMNRARPGRDHPGDHGSRGRRGVAGLKEPYGSLPPSPPGPRSATSAGSRRSRGVVIEAVFPDELPEINSALRSTATATRRRPRASARARATS